MALGVGASQQGTTASSLSQATTAVTTAAAGSLIVAGEIYSRNTSTFSTLADSKSNTYALIGSQQNFETVNGAARLHYKENAIGGASHTATFTQTGTAGPIAAFMAEFTGVATLGALDTNAQTNDVASPFTASVTPSAGRRILVALFAGNSGSNPATHAESSGFTILTNCNSTNGATTWTGCIAYRIVTADGSAAFTASFTETGGTDTAVILAAFKEAATAASIPKLSPGRSPGKLQFLRSRPTYSAAVAAPPSGDIAGTGGITFGQSGILTGTGVLAATNGLTLGQSGALTGAGALAGSASITFGQSGSLGGAGALAGSSALTFGQTGAVTAAGALAGSTSLTFGQLGALTANGVLAGTAAITFGGTATADQPAGEMSGTASITFSASATLTADAALAGIAGLVFAGSATADQPIPAGGGIGQMGGGGGSIDYQSHKPRKPNLRKQLDEILDSAEAAYHALISGPEPEVAAKIVKPFAEDKREAIPPPEEIDWKAVERDVTRTRRLIAMATKLELQRQMDEDDDEFMLLH